MLHVAEVVSAVWSSSKVGEGACIYGLLCTDCLLRDLYGQHNNTIYGRERDNDEERNRKRWAKWRILKGTSVASFM